MNKGASDNRTCDKCGYVFSPFETDCPKCARSASVSSATDVSATGKPDSPLHDAMKVAQKTLAVLGFLLIAAIIVGIIAIFVTVIRENPNRNPGLFVIVVLPILCILGVVALILVIIEIRIIKLFTPNTPPPSPPPTAAHPDARDAPADQPIAPSQYEVRRMPVLHRRPLAIAGAIGFILATVIIGGLLLPGFLEKVGGTQTFDRLYLIAASLIAIFLGYLLGIPSLWEEVWRYWIDSIFAAIELCFGFLVLGVFVAMLADDSDAGIMLVGLFFAGIFYLISSAALSHVLHTQPDRKLSALVDVLIVGGIISYFIILKALH